MTGTPPRSPRGGTASPGCRQSTVTGWPRAARRWLCSRMTRAAPPWVSIGETSATTSTSPLATARPAGRLVDRGEHRAPTGRPLVPERLLPELEHHEREQTIGVIPSPRV